MRVELKKRKKRYFGDMIGKLLLYLLYNTFNY